HGDAASGDELFGFSTRSDSSGGEDFLKAIGHVLANVNKLAVKTDCDQRSAIPGTVRGSADSQEQRGCVLTLNRRVQPTCLYHLNVCFCFTPGCARCNLAVRRGIG